MAFGTLESRGEPGDGGSAAHGRRDAVTRFVACARALQDDDFRSTLSAIEQPTLLIAGAEDGTMPQTMRALTTVIPNATCVEIPDAGHIPGLERPDAFNEALKTLLHC